jgi:hypothetical protein
MANITPGKDPQFYVGAVDTTWSFSANVDKVSYSTNGLPPAISKYIAYDTLVPPNPFIAVTQDGAGNVVYDGGFPKFYNTEWFDPSVPTSFATLKASYKFLANALDFCANKLKVTAGNRKILWLGDMQAPNNYAVKTVGGAGFYDSIIGICNVMGWVPTIKDVSDYNGTSLDARFAELDQYAAVVLFSSLHVPRITDNCEADLVTYRQVGNGIIVITDDGPDITSLADAYPNAGTRQFFATANKLVRNFGAYFTGLYDRSPVNVGFLRSTYGDHPLYNGMANTDSIFAGGSESKVVVQTFTQYNPNEVPTIPITTPGENSVNFLLVLKDGSIETHRFKYSIITGEFLFHKNSQGTQLTGYQDTLKGVWDGGLKTNVANPPTMLGDILLNGVRMGTFVFDGVNTSYKFLAGPRGFSMKAGDVLTHKVTEPYIYQISVTVRNPTPVTGFMRQAAVRRQMARNEYAGLSADAAFTQMSAMAQAYFSDGPVILPTYRATIGPLIRMLSGGPTGAAQVPVFLTTADTTAGLPGLTDTSVMAVNAQTGVIWWYVNNAWVQSGQNLETMFGLGRKIVSTLNNGTWQVLAANSLAKIK